MNRRFETRSARWFRRLLRLLPYDFRWEHGREMEQDFRARRREQERSEGGRLGMLKLWWETLTDIAHTAPREHFDILRQDARYAVRMMGRNRGFTVVAILTLALGIGANTAIFSFIHDLFWQRPAVPESDRLVRLYGTDGDRRFDSLSYPAYRDLRDRTEVFEGLAAYRGVTITARLEGGESVTLRAELVSGHYFSVFGVPAALGRELNPQDDAIPGGHPVAVIGDGFWLRQYARDPSVLGSVVRIHGTPFTIVGVMPARFQGSYQLYATDIWAPVMMHEQVRPIGASHESRGWGWLGGAGRLKPGVSLEKAQADLDRVAGLLEQEFPRFQGGVGYRVVPAGVLPDRMQEGLKGALSLLALLVGLLLAGACANIAGVLFARVVVRQREMAVRRSLGAGRSRLVRQWVTEGILLALAGGLAGLVVAHWSQRALLLLVSSDRTFAHFSPNLQFGGTVLGFTFLLALLTGLFCSLFPATRAAGFDVWAALKEEAGTAAGGRGRSRLQNVFVGAQVSVSLFLLVVAGLLIRTLREADAFDPGFQTRNVLRASVNLAPHGYEEARGRDFYARLSARLQGLPGVQSVTYTTLVPLSGDADAQMFHIEGHEPSLDQPLLRIDTAVVGPNYFQTLGIPILRGRDFTPEDAQPGAQPVVVINETMARRYWLEGNAVGEHFRLGTNGPQVEIIGIARDSKYHALGEEPIPYVYGTAGQVYLSSANFLVRTSGDPARLVSQVQGTVSDLDRSMEAENVGTMAQLRQSIFLPQRALAVVSTAFSLLAVLLTGLGLFGVVSHSVTQRNHEIGIRMALGARRGAILRWVFQLGLGPTLLGLGAGTIAAVAATRLLKGLLFGVSPTDPWTFLAVVGLLAAVALLACWIPARRAMKVDPMPALRYQ